MGSTNNSAKALASAIGLKATDIPEDLAAGIDFDINSSLLSSQQLLNDTGDTAKQFMTGEIPEDLRDQIEDISTSKALSSGLGLGEAGRKLVARDFGLTSLDLRRQGAEMGLQTATAQNQLTSLASSIEESRKNFVALLSDAKASRAQIRLAGAEVISKNQQYITGLASDLIARNAVTPIAGLQENINFLMGNEAAGRQGYLDPTNTAILDIINEFV